MVSHVSPNPLVPFPYHNGPFDTLLDGYFVFHSFTFSHVALLPCLKPDLLLTGLLEDLFLLFIAALAGNGRGLPAQLHISTSRHLTHVVPGNTQTGYRICRQLPSREQHRSTHWRSSPSHRSTQPEGLPPTVVPSVLVSWGYRTYQGESSEFFSRSFPPYLPTYLPSALKPDPAVAIRWCDSN